MQLTHEQIKGPKPAVDAKAPVYQGLLDKVEVLPASPSLLPKLLPHLGDVNSNFDEIVRIISLEQTLTAKLLQICNSAFFGLSEPVSTVSEAVNHAGYQSIYLLAAMINGSVCFPLKGSHEALVGRIWKHSVATAFNTSLAAESAGLNSSIAFTAGLMHDLGKVVLLQKADPAAAEKLCYSASKESLVTEEALFGCHHAELGGALLERWKLPSDLVSAVRFHHNPQQAGTVDTRLIAACVAVGNFVTHSAQYPQVSEFVDAMRMLELDISVFKRWQTQFAESKELIDGMSKLPL